MLGEGEVEGALTAGAGPFVAVEAEGVISDDKETDVDDVVSTNVDGDVDCGEGELDGAATVSWIVSDD